MIKIGTWLVNPETCTMSRGDEEEKLSPRAMDVLVCLAENAPNVVSMETLLDRFWTAHSSSDHAVHKVLATLRRAFGDKPSDPSYIKTFPKRGYAIIAAVEFLAAAEPQAQEPAATNEQPLHSPARKIELGLPAIAASVLALLLVIAAFVFDSGTRSLPTDSVKIVAVGPADFVGLEQESRGDYARGDYISSGLNAGLVSNLSKLTGLRVVKLEQNSSANALSAAREVGATHLLQSRIVESAEQYSLNLELLELENGSTIYSEDFQLEPGDLLTTQNQLTDNVVDSLSIYLDDQQRAAMHDWGTANALAYKHFLKAEFFKEQWNHEDWRQALSHYEKAIELDPAFVNAYSGLATAGNYLAVYSPQAVASEVSELLQDYARKLALERPGHATVETLKSAALNSGGQLHELASIYSSRIIQGNAPKYVYAQYGLYLQGARLYAEAEQFFELANVEAPYKTSPNQQINFSVASMAPWNSVPAWKQRLFEQPRHIGILGLLIRSQALIGNMEEANYYFQQQASVDKQGIRTHLSKIYLSAISGELFTLARAGDSRDELAAKLNPRFPELFDEANLEHPDLQFNNGVMKLILGDIDAAAEHMRQLNAIDRRSLGTRLHGIEVMFPDRVLQDPAYHALLEELGFGRSWQQKLMREIREMQPVTGIRLTAQAEQALREDRFMSQNTLWDEAQWSLLQSYKNERIAEITEGMPISGSGNPGGASSF
jgi:DNA-binding winged helix-turn-helix (wHTH) protein/TolB-like protein/Tfp pilus assembly protein PilF